MAAAASHFADDFLKMCAYLYETLADPEMVFSSAPDKCAFNKAFDTDGTIWEFYERPEQKERHSRFVFVMTTAEKLESPELIAKAFDWTSLPDNEIVVDVGGGVGNVAIRISKANPKLKVICQDLPKTVEAAKNYWKGEEEKAIISSGRVSFEENNFFSTQPVQNASVYFVKHILHDWSDERALAILRAFRVAAGPDTKRDIMEKVMPCTCLSQGEEGAIPDVPGYMKPTLAAPLTNVGAATARFPYMASLTMMMLGNGQERTLGHFIDLYRKDG